MSSYSTLADLLPFAVSLLIAGGVAGFLAGVFGIGGGAILVPVFYQMLGILGVDEAVRMHVAVGTSLAIIVPTSLRSFMGHYAKGVVDMDVLRQFLVFVPLGVISASIVAAYISSGMLRAIFAVAALLISAKLLFGRDDWKLGDDIPKGPASYFSGWLIGFLSTFMGIGGGVFTNTFMTLFGRKMHQAVATSSGVGVLIAIPGVFGYIWAGWGVPGLPEFSIGYVNLLIVLIIIPVTLLVAPMGVRVAHILTKRQLEFGFGVFLLLVSIRFFVSLG